MFFIKVIIIFLFNTLYTKNNKHEQLCLKNILITKYLKNKYNFFLLN